MVQLTAMRSEEETAFLFELYASTRQEEVAAWGWDEPMQREFLKMQWRAQTLSYSAQFPNAEHHLIRFEEQSAGRLLLDQNEDRLLLIDLSLLPAFRNQGIGNSLLASLQEQAAESRVPLHLHVLKTNPALRLYQRMGFRPVHDDGLHLLMEWLGEEEQSIKRGDF